MSRPTLLQTDDQIALTKRAKIDFGANLENVNNTPKSEMATKAKRPTKVALALQIRALKLTTRVRLLTNVLDESIDTF